jgi:hypothetical protein
MAGKRGRPAASELVQPGGRVALEVRSKVASQDARQPVGDLKARQNS